MREEGKEHFFSHGGRARGAYILFNNVKYYYMLTIFPFYTVLRGRKGMVLFSLVGKLRCISAI